MIGAVGATGSFEDRNSGSVQTQIQRGRNLARSDRLHMAAFIFGHFGPQRLSRTFDLLGANVQAGQFLQQPTAL